MAHRIEEHVERGSTLELTLDGEVISARQGETLAGVLLLDNKSAFYRTRSGAPRAPFCNMGTCFECRVHVAGRGWVLACMTTAESGMVVRTGQLLPLTGDSGDAH